ncbi:ferritin-like domain-containing protein [Sulfurimonas lithotrophica]|uniref:Ferritin-like domain-containing protein n=1 Tax=Sulfurimonas lithotrophica TaxID=2590022 RepID=A0A5P8P1B7_9BACT|nr:ferritin-like domain-containing protein [Sulfurimonas lithotrophica]QFR49522.1 ferritin-like domain-containing protein [Sulfurimonas lithotrophica]
MNFYNELEEIIKTQNPHDKFVRFYSFYAKYQNNECILEKYFKPKFFEEPSYASVCKIVPPQVVPKRSNLTTKEGQVNLLHAIAHIEYSAIDLALDAAYRFQDLPKEYYDDWLEVAEDEIRHFKMLEKLLHKIGANYGDIEVHNSLFEASQKTQNLLERMAVVPRYLEANGLDATPLILKKLDRLQKDEILNELVSSLNVILEEEVSHVKKGDKWFEYACQKEKKDKDIYFQIIDKYYPQGFDRARDINKDARLEAGFSCRELKDIAHKNVC